MSEIKIFSTKYLRIWHTLDSFGFSVVLNLDYVNLIVRIGTIVVVIGQ